MNDGKDARGFFRRVVNFVVNPRVDPPDTRSSELDQPDSEFARSELKAMIERKRRNDFVRKRELDLLRKLRREGLTPEQLAVLGSSSDMADTESRADELGIVAEPGMKARIDEIEQQMATHVISPAASAKGQAQRAASTSRQSPPPRDRPLFDESDAFARSMADTIIDTSQLDEVPAASAQPARAPAPALPSSMSRYDTSAMDSEVEVTEFDHDPDLDEAVISYANGDFTNAENQLATLIRKGGSRRDHPETWMVIFDLYRATGQQQPFEALAVEFAERFSQSAPHWFSVPRMVADSAAENRPSASHIDGNVSWTCPMRIDAAAVQDLQSRTRHAPLPWVIDWTGFDLIDSDGCAPLLGLFSEWVSQNVDMRWFGGEVLLRRLAEATPMEQRSVDPQLWQLRLVVLRMVNRPERFDEVAIDYCVTYEISPPSWEPSACRVRISGPVGASTLLGTTSVIGDASTTFVESELAPEGTVKMARLDLSGQLVGDIGAALDRLDQQIGDSALIELSCQKLLRVDFMASGELLNWVLAHTRQQRRVSFVDTNRLVARFFSAIGLDAHASISVRAV